MGFEQWVRDVPSLLRDELEKGLLPALDSRAAATGESLRDLILAQIGHPTDGERGRRIRRSVRSKT